MQLPACERLGDIRETALTWGKSADIAYLRGDYGDLDCMQGRAQTAATVTPCHGPGLARQHH